MMEDDPGYIKDAIDFFRRCKEITDRGDTAEVKNRNGQMIILEVRKKLRPWAGEIGHR